MSPKIEDPEVLRLSQKFAAMSGLSEEAGIKRALEEAIHGEYLREQVRKLQGEFAALPKGDPNFTDKDLYDEYGLPA